MVQNFPTTGGRAAVNKIHHDHEDLGSNIFANILITILGLLKRAVSLEWGGGVCVTVQIFPLC